MIDCFYIRAGNVEGCNDCMMICRGRPPFGCSRGHDNKKHIYAICELSGNTVLDYVEAGYNVILIDPEHETMQDGNVTMIGETIQWMLEIAEFLPPAWGIFFMPPCTDFTVSGAQYWPEKDRDGRTASSLEIVDAGLEFIDRMNPEWHVTENPVGRLPKLRPDRLGKPAMYFNPCDYGDPYTKKTCLWGDFTPPLPLFLGEDRSVEPERVSSQGSWLMKLGGKSKRTKMLRSVTPRQFARAFFEVNR